MIDLNKTRLYVRRNNPKALVVFMEEQEDCFIVLEMAENLETFMYSSKFMKTNSLEEYLRPANDEDLKLVGKEFLLKLYTKVDQMETQIRSLCKLKELVTEELKEKNLLAEVTKEVSLIRRNKAA